MILRQFLRIMIMNGRDDAKMFTKMRLTYRCAHNIMKEAYRDERNGGEVMVVGVTGPSGAGKGLVVKRFAAHGFCVIDADRVAREVVRPGEATLIRLTEAFGGEILLPDGTLNRRGLAAIAFASRENTDRLNAIMHGEIRRRMLARADACRAAHINVIFDAPQLFEAGMEDACDCCVAVTAPLEIRVKRLTDRDGLTEQEIRRRVARQHEDSFFIERCQYHICNDGDIAQLERKTEAVIGEILRVGDEGVS